MKKIILIFALFFLTIYIPLSITIYSQNWYEFNYEKQDTYENLNKQDAINATENLINYFLFQEKLSDDWSESEKIHMNDVRNIYSVLFAIAVLSFLMLSIHSPGHYQFKKYSLFNIVIIIILSAMIFNFNYIFDEIFHPLLFNNDLWVFGPDDISYYLFPYEFFQRSFIFIITFSLIENIVIILSTIKYKNRYGKI